VDWKERMEERGDEAEKKAIYFNLGDMLEQEYWHGLMLGLVVGAIAGLLMTVTFNRE
jgi:hypothetical protein